MCGCANLLMCGFQIGYYLIIIKKLIENIYYCNKCFYETANFLIRTSAHYTLGFQGISIDPVCCAVNLASTKR